MSDQESPLFVAEPTPEAPAAEPEEATPEAPEQPAEPAPPPEADGPAKRAMEDMARREQQLLSRERQIAGLSRAQQAVASGNHRAAAEALGIDVHKLLADVWGQDMLPEKAPPSVDDEVKTIRQQLEETRRELAQTRGQTARYQLYSKLGAEVAKRPELEIVSHLAAQTGEPFFDQLIDYAVEQEQATGQRPGWDEVLAYAEQQYEQRYCNLAESMVQLKKIRSRFGINEPEQVKKPVPPKPAPRKTLVNALNSDPPKAVEQPLTSVDRRAAALKAIKDGYAKGKAQETDLEIT